jgi:hypothetical protein
LYALSKLVPLPMSCRYFLQFAISLYDIALLYKNYRFLCWQNFSLFLCFKKFCTILKNSSSTMTL